MPQQQAKLTNLADPSRREHSQRYETFFGGGGGMVETQQVSLDSADCRAVGDEVTVSFSESGASVEWLPQAVDMPENWRGYDALKLTAVCGDKPLTLTLTVLHARCRLVETAELAAGDTDELDMDLIDLPLGAGIKPLFEPTGIKLSAEYEGEGPREVVLKELTLVPAKSDSPRPCVDRFGQRVNGDWPNKVTSEDQLREAAEKEAEQLAKMERPADRDIYGGWTGPDAPDFEATGFFRVEQDSDGRWWTVDPEGNPFLSVGTTGVRTTDQTPTEGREFLYEELPDKDGPYASAWLDKGLSFYKWNILRKYGSLQGWRDRVLQRFSKWGFNTIANWSQEIMLDQQVIPHVRTLGSRLDGAPMASRRFADVFDPKWEKMLDESFAEKAAPHSDDPWLIGYFVDNEMPWRNMRLLSADAGAAVRKAWADFCRERFADVREAGKVLGVELSDFSDVAEMTDEQIPDSGPAREAMTDFEVRYAEKYFSTVRRILKSHDPNHMYMGCRFVRRMPAEGIVKAAGEYSDIVSVNCYGLYPEREEFQPWHDVSGRPVQIGEHHLPLLSERQLQPLYQAFTPAERRTGYVKYVSELVKMPFGLGCHWFQHADQPLTGRFQDGEDQPVGFVDITDQPHPELVEAAREVTENMYHWHAVSE